MRLHFDDVTVPLKCTQRYRHLHGEFGGPIAHHFLHFTARNRCGAYNPVTPGISFWLVRKNTTALKMATLLVKSTPDLFKFTWIGPNIHENSKITMVGHTMSL